jgi:hypothetical protein
LTIKVFSFDHLKANDKCGTENAAVCWMECPSAARPPNKDGEALRELVMKKKILVVLVIIAGPLLLAPLSFQAHGAPVLLADVPAYEWYHGCGPTAAGSIFGYWDLRGYSNVFDAAGAGVYLTSNVQDHISSPAHNAKYDGGDDPFLPVPPKTSIADWFKTSVDPLPYGWSYQSDAPDAFIGYAGYRGYNFSSWDKTYGPDGFTWSDLRGEINAGRPMLFLVDSSGDGETDHFVPVFGYDDRGQEGLWYAMYTTWSEEETVEWRPFQGMSDEWNWGVGYATFVQPEGSPVPEPSTWMLLGSGILTALGWRRKFKKHSSTCPESAIL